MYPRFSQTFIINEVLELERQGLDITIGSLRKFSEGRFQEQVCRVQAEVHYFPETLCRHTSKTLAVHASLLRRAPDRYLRAIAVALRYAGATLFDLVQAGFLVRWAQKRQLDLLHVHFGTSEATVALLARILGGPPYSLALHTWDVFRHEVDRTLLGRKINASRFTVVNTDYHRRQIMRSIPRIDAEKIRLNYNGVEVEQFRPREAPRNRQSLFAVGRLVEKKGFAHLIRVIRLLHNRGLPVSCAIAGDGRERAHLEEEIRRERLDSSVTLLGPLQHARVRELMQTCGCFVLPCVRGKDGNIDGIPNVLIEALACGCPCVSTRLSGIPELVENSVTGLLAAPGDEQGLADAIQTMLTNPQLADRLAAAGRQRVAERFDIHRNMAILHEWLRSEAKASRAAAGTAREPTKPERTNTRIATARAS
jgi:glycosyltransferase involved in cell wall biosynthesis